MSHLVRLLKIESLEGLFFWAIILLVAAILVIGAFFSLVDYVLHPPVPTPVIVLSELELAVEGCVTQYAIPVKEGSTAVLRIDTKAITQCLRQHEILRDKPPE